MDLSNGFYRGDSFPCTGPKKGSSAVPWVIDISDLRPKDDEGNRSPRLTKNAVDRLSLPHVGVNQLVERLPW